MSATGVGQLHASDRTRDLGPVHCSALLDAVRGLDDAAWTAKEYRQRSFNVHRSTQSIVLCFIDLDKWPDLAIARDVGWEALGDSAEPVMETIIARCYPPGGVVIRAMAVRLPAGARITPHVDEHESLRLSHRIHLPLVTNPRVRFFIDGVPHRFEPRCAVEVNNQLSHSVMNDGTVDRIHFIFDYLPPDALAGQAPDRP
ncbi:MAG: aspartyl/asparaginyl beta-hydroxylase domain-containing protein [Gammaproteobacteria bacterium]|nr:aspartyl/asparaginyl beta-hydroxylase domain-containing protein [Gammaproteobacteria bacterium]MDE0441356.1 aspartyl/asparaginyl beta-hydroxylase domain-containing protein [Gammaproteobacteria bacterium]